MNNSNKLLVGVSNEPVKVKLNNGFVVTDFIVSTEVDFVYSKSNGAFYLLNLDALGEMGEQEIVALVKNGQSVAVIEGLEMEVYNMDEKVVLAAMIGI